MSPSSNDPAPSPGGFSLRGAVPYIAAWSSEQEQHTDLVVRRGRLGYADELPFDRDRFGILWRRVGSSPGKGRPEFGKVHSLRQRRAMLRVLCQVCGGPADRNRNGVLWLMGLAAYASDPWPTPIESPHPPLCLNCAVTAVRLCPHLRSDHVALRVRRFHPSAVNGALYALTPPKVEAVDLRTLALDSREAAWVKASQLIMRLADYRVVDLAAEAADRGLSL